MDVNKKQTSIRYSYIDGLKGIAMLGVIMAHSGASILPGVFGKIGAAGAKGVQLFFIITAYLSCMSFQKVNQNKDGKNRWLIERLFRIAPLYYLAILIYLLVMGTNSRYWLGNYPYVSWQNVLSHFLFINGFNPFYINSILGVEWYIAVIVIFYIVIFLFFKKMNSLGKASVWLTSSLILYFFIKILSHRISFGDNDYIWRNYMDGFSIFPAFPILMMGVVLFYVINTVEYSGLKEKNKLSYAIGIFSVYFIFCLISGESSIGGKLGTGITTEALYGIGFMGLILSQNMKSWKLIDNILFKMIGKYSYGMFLFHMLFLFLYDKYIPSVSGNTVLDWGIKYLLIVLISFGTAYCAEKLIEVPIKKMRKKFIVRKTREVCYEEKH